MDHVCTTFTLAMALMTLTFYPGAAAEPMILQADSLKHYIVVTKADYFKTLKIYTNCQRLKRPDGSMIPWIDENLNPLTGDWISRTRLKTRKNRTWDPGKGGKERGKDSCDKPFAIYDEKSNRWRLWCSGRKGGAEQIGLALHPGRDLGF